MRKMILALFCCLFFVSPVFAAEVDCIVDQVANMGNRVHVHCKTPETSAIKPSPFPFYALPLDSPLVTTFTIMGQAVAMENQKDSRDHQITQFCAYLSGGGSVGCKSGSPVNGKVTTYGLPYTLHIWYGEKDTSGNAYGCAANDCRKPYAFGILK